MIWSYAYWRAADSLAVIEHKPEERTGHSVRACHSGFMIRENEDCSLQLTDSVDKAGNGVN